MHTITEEQLASFESDYITRESAAIIADEVRRTSSEPIDDPNKLIARGIELLQTVCQFNGHCWIFNTVPDCDCSIKTCPAKKVVATRNGCSIRDYMQDCKRAGIDIPRVRR
jgi:hypothetical protein